MIARHDDDLAPRARLRDSERVALSLHDERRHRDRVELRQPARRVGAARRVQREREAQHGARAGRAGGPACDAGPRRSPADDERQPAQLVRAQRLHDGDPGRVELRRRRGRAAAGDAVRLLDERDREPLLERDGGRGGKVARADAAARAVTEHERRARVDGSLQVDAREPRRRLDVYCGCGTIRMYGFGDCHSPKSSFASSFDTEPAMITSSPGFQLTGVETLCFAVSCSESITRSTSSKLRPVVIG